jgi:hypothetical protein
MSTGLLFPKLLHFDCTDTFKEKQGKRYFGKGEGKSLHLFLKMKKKEICKTCSLPPSGYYMITTKQKICIA